MRREDKEGRGEENNMRGEEMERREGNEEDRI